MSVHSVSILLLLTASSGPNTSRMSDITATELEALGAEVLESPYDDLRTMSSPGGFVFCLGYLDGFFERDQTGGGQGGAFLFGESLVRLGALAGLRHCSSFRAG